MAGQAALLGLWSREHAALVDLSATCQQEAPPMRRLWLDFDIISYSMYSHDPTAEIQLVAKVPRDIVDFMLFVGDHPIYFTAKEKVQDLISAHY
jgi:hypothetical protein